jgi:hypothetical protein
MAKGIAKELGTEMHLPISKLMAAFDRISISCPDVIAPTEARIIEAIGGDVLAADVKRALRTAARLGKVERVDADSTQKHWRRL